METHAPNRRPFKLLLFLATLLFISYLGQGLSQSIQKLNTRICIDEPVAFEKTNIDDPNLDINTRRIAIAGSNGVKKVCRDGYGSFVSESVITQPVTEVTHSGTKPRPYIPPVIQYEELQGGSICNDGSWSPSTGRGTCSWHGGIDYYL